MTPPKDLNLTQSVIEPTALKSAMAAAAGLCSVSVVGPVQAGGEALYRFIFIGSS